MSLLSTIRDRLFGDDPPVDPGARALVEQLAEEVRAAGVRETQPPDRFVTRRPVRLGARAARGSPDAPAEAPQGDLTLSIILSKAFLVAAADARITDRSIVSQTRRPPS